MKPTTVIDCTTAQQFLDDLGRGRLAEPMATQIRQHLADCTDCRVIHQRSSRLQRLLALKRYEQPAPQYFDNFLTEFHRRWAAEEAKPGFWQHFFSWGDANVLGSWRFSYAGACGLALVVGLVWVGLRNSHEAVATTSEFSLPANIAFANPSPSAPAEFLPPAEVSIGRDVPSIATLNGGITLTSASMERSQPTSPRYVLDRIAITPASYDVPQADF